MNHTLPNTDKEQYFAQIYEAYVDDLYRLCFSFMKNQMDAEDAVQETFMKFYHLSKEFKNDKHLKAWLIVTASNYCKDLLKHWWRKRATIDNCTEISYEDDNLRSEFMELILNLPKKYKTAVYLYYYEGYDSREIANILHKPDSTIRTWLQKAKKLLKQELIEEGSIFYGQQYQKNI